MSPRQWWRGIRRRRRRKKAAAANRDQPLREFVYLDEVSVFSLLASRIGPLATEFTESESSSLTTEAKAGGRVSAPIASANVSSSIQAGETSGTQVMRKSTVQSTFRELHSYVQDSLVLALMESESPPSDARPMAALLDDAASESLWIVDNARLRRGELVEVEVELDADESFQLTTMVSTFIELLEEMPRVPENLDMESVMNAIAGTRMLTKLLVGLVPVRGRVVDYAWIDVAGREVVVHRTLHDRLPESFGPPRPLYVVGVAEAGLFWRDLRRVLFSGSRYRMLCRVDRDGIQPNWTPVKLMDVLEGVAPGLRASIDELPLLLERVGDREQSDRQPAALMRTALRNYAETICARHGHPLDLSDLTARGLPTDEQCEAHGSVESRRAAFASLTNALVAEFNFVPDPEVLARERMSAWFEASTWGVSQEPDPIQVSARHVEGAPSRYLDCEIIAVYW